jgi:hypothetical protein
VTDEHRLAISVARLEGKMDRLAEILRRVEVQTTKTNGRVDQHADAIDSLESKDHAREAAEAVRSQLAEVVKRERAESRASRFAWVAAAGTVGGLVAAIASYISPG